MRDISSQELERKAICLLEEAPLLDGHNDLPDRIRTRFQNHLDRIDIAKSTKEVNRGIPLQTDIPRLRQGHVGGVFFAAFVPPGLGPAAVPYLFEQIDLIRRLAARHPDAFGVALTAADIRRIRKSGRIAVLIGIENGDAIGNSLAVLRQAFACGARYLTLTHVTSTDWADAGDSDPATPGQARHGGLTSFGREVVKEMNRLGMIVDVSHVSDATAVDALRTSEAPIIFSHSSARALCHSPRNVPDDILRLLKTNDGMIMVNFYSAFISEEVRIAYLPTDIEWNRLRDLYPDDLKRADSEYSAWFARQHFPRATISQVVDHIDHIRNIAGIDHVGLGSDFDGAEDTVVGLDDVSGYPALIAELLLRGYEPKDIIKIAGGNILRVMRSVEEVAQRVQRVRPASEARIEDLDRTTGAGLPER